MLVRDGRQRSRRARDVACSASDRGGVSRRGASVRRSCVIAAKNPERHVLDAEPTLGTMSAASADRKDPISRTSSRLRVSRDGGGTRA